MFTDIAHQITRDGLWTKTDYKSSHVVSHTSYSDEIKALNLSQFTNLSSYYICNYQKLSLVCVTAQLDLLTGTLEGPWLVS